MTTHYYLIYKKRQHTTNVRFKDHVGVVYCERYKPPFKRNGYGMRNVDWWGKFRNS